MAAPKGAVPITRMGTCRVQRTHLRPRHAVWGDQTGLGQDRVALLGSVRPDTEMPGSRGVWTACLWMLHPHAPGQGELELLSGI